MSNQLNLSKHGKYGKIYNQTVSVMKWAPQRVKKFKLGVVHTTSDIVETGINNAECHLV